MTQPKTSDDDDAIVALIPGLTRAAQALTGSRSDAEDLVQEALLQVWAQQRAGAEITALPAYAKATLRNKLRRRRREPVTAPLDDQTMESMTAETGPRRIAFSEVMSAIAYLPDPQRDALVEVVVMGTSPESLAARRGIAKGTVLSRLARARARLRKELDLPPGRPAASFLLPPITGGQ